jgi:N-acetylglucosaminyldiphosphoundecaprenol N-acetyl-beta-D-mannosaminyltransferase
MMERRTVEILGCRVDPVSGAEVIERVFRWCDAPERRSHIIVTVNVAILMTMRDDPALAHAIRQADLVVVDGKPLVWTARWFHSPVPERVPGVDLMRRLLETGTSRGLRIFLLGTTELRLSRLTQVIIKRYPGVVIAGARNGYFTAADTPEVTGAIRESRADLLLVGMPAPFKEIWCERHRAELCTPAILGVGGAFDVLAGFVPRAPVRLQDAGLEWAWRLAMEPRKLWRRYLVTNTRFLACLAKTSLTGRRARSP